MLRSDEDRYRPDDRDRDRDRGYDSPRRPRPGDKGYVVRRFNSGDYTGYRDRDRDRDRD
jgi:hypothetical protein